MKTKSIISWVRISLAAAMAFLVSSPASAGFWQHNIRVTGGVGQIKIEWDASPDASSYNVYWGMMGTVTPAVGGPFGPQQIAHGIKKTVYYHTGFTYNSRGVSETQYYGVTRNDADGKEMDEPWAGATGVATSATKAYGRKDTIVGPAKLYVGDTNYYEYQIQTKYSGFEPMPASRVKWSIEGEEYVNAVGVKLLNGYKYTEDHDGILLQVKPISKKQVIKLIGCTVNSSGEKTGSNVTNVVEIIPLSSVTFAREPTSIHIAYSSHNYVCGRRYGELPTATRDGYYFDGWYALGIPYRITTETDVLEGDWVFHPKFVPHSYVVRFNSNGGTGNMGSMKCTYDQSQKLSKCSFSRNDYIFEGWAKSPKGPVAYKDGDTISNLTTVNNAVVDLYAVWKKIIRYSLKFNANGGIGEMPAMNMQVGTAKKLSANVFSREGHTFEGWANSPTGKVIYKDGNEVLDLTEVDGSTVVLYAVWKIITYPIRYEAGAFGSGSPIEEMKEYGKNIRLRSEKFTRENHLQVGWALEDGGDKAYDLNAVYAANAPLTLYPVWIVHDYTPRQMDAEGRTWTYRVLYGRAELICGDDWDCVIDPLPSGDITLPEHLGGFAVSRVDEFAFANCLDLESVLLPANCESVGRGAFSGCVNLAKVHLPEGLVELESDAFANCASLGTLEIPASVEDVGEGAFNGCVAMSNFVVVVENPRYASVDGVLYDKDVHTLLICPMSKGSVRIPASVTGIADLAFSGCYALRNLELPEGLTSIGRWAFDRSGIRSLKIPGGVTKIEAESLCGQFSSLVLCAGVEEIGDGAISSIELVSVELPGTLRKIHDRAFANCFSLMSVEIPSSVTNIGACVFESCQNLQSVCFQGDAPTVSREIFCGASDNLVVNVFPEKQGWKDGRAELLLRWPQGEEPRQVRAWQGSFPYTIRFHDVDYESSCSERKPDRPYEQVFSYGVAQALEGVRFVNEAGRSFDGWQLGDGYSIQEDGGSIGDRMVVKNVCGVEGGVVDLYARWRCSTELHSGLEWRYDIVGGAVRLRTAVSRVYLDDGRKKIIIPEKLGGLPVVEIGSDSMFGWYDVQEFVLPATIKRIGDRAFGYCEQLTKMTYLGDESKIAYGEDVFAGSPYDKIRGAVSSYMLYFISGEGDSQMKMSMSCKIGQVYKLLSKDRVSSGAKRFAGWACSNGRRYDDGMLVFDLAQPGETVTMTAVWE